MTFARFIVPCRNWTRWLFSLAGLSLLGGCAGSEGSVAGKVTLNGKALALGSVVLVNQETHAIVQGAIEPNGTFRIANVPFGAYKAAVHSPEPGKHRDMGRPIPEELKEKYKSADHPPPAADKWFAIPERYGDWRRSGLSVTVSGSRTTFDIKLED